MTDPHGFDEVMIVNPYDPRMDLKQGARDMRFGQPPEMGYYAEDPYGYYSAYGYYGEPDMGYYADPGYGYYGQPPDLGYYAGPYTGYHQEPTMGWYGEGPYGAYAQPPEVSYFADDPTAGYGDPGIGCCESGRCKCSGRTPELVGWGEPDPYGVPDVAEPPENVSGYMRDAPPVFNAGCPMPTNVSGMDEPQPLDGYLAPRDVSPTCREYTPPPDGGTPPLPDTLKPLW